MQLYKLTGEYERVLNMIDTEEDVQEILNDIDAIKGTIADKVQDIIRVMRSIEADEEAIKNEEKRLYDRRLSLQNRRESIKEYVEECMVRSKISKVSTPLFTVYMQNNKKSVIANENDEGLKAYKDVWVAHPDTLDRTKVYELLSKGQEIPGARLNQTQSLRIR